MSSLSTLPKGDSAWLLRKSIQRIMQQVSVLETNIGSSTTGNSANTQVIFNDNGTLRGDTGLTFNKTTDLLTVGAATITGDLTVDTSTLKVDSANNRVGIVNASPSFALDVNGAGSGVSARISSGSGTGFRFDTTRNVGGLNRNYLIGCDVLNEGWFSIVPSTALGGGTFTNSIYNASYDGTHAWSDGAGGERMRLNATGLGVGTSPTYKLDVSSSSNIVGRLSSSSVFNTGFNITNTTGSTWSLYSFGSNDATLQNSFGIYHQSGTSFLQITQAGNVGIGVTPSAWGIYKGLQVGYASLAGYAGSDTLLGSNVYFDGGAFKYIAAGLASSYRQLAGGHQWSTAVAGANPGDPLTLLPQMTLDASGNLSLANGNLVMGTSGKGIDFSATASGSGTMTSELLNDYEEGTWTPTFTFTTPGTLAISYADRIGSYTKVGRLVTVRFQIGISPGNFVKGTANGQLQISGLPFTVGSAGTQYFDLAASLADQNSGTLVFATPSVSAIFFERLSVSGTRVIRDSGAITDANFAATNAGWITIAAVVTYTV